MDSISNKHFIINLESVPGRRKSIFQLKQTVNHNESLIDNLILI